MPVAYHRMSCIPKILIVDDEEIMRDSLTDWLREDGYQTAAVENGEKALERIRKERWDLILLDLKMPGMNGIEVLKEVKKINKELPVIIITAYATVDTAVEAMKIGACDYIAKPFNPEELGLVIKRVLDHQNLIKENIYLRKELKKSYTFRDLISRNPKMQEIFDLIKRVAKSDSTVFITGESGTGKELVARAIHSESHRKKGPFIVVNCAALTESLLESELFGHEKGSFTGAYTTKPGIFEFANHGTLFLDEVGEMGFHTQADLLRVLEEKKFRRVGGKRLIEVDVRIISATNKDLKKRVEQGKFREDLYYRLNVVPIHIPPLRERKEDIPLLSDYFLEKYCLKNRKEIKGFSEKAMEVLMNYDWPGNIRELENVIERTVVITRDKIIKPKDLPSFLRKEVREKFIEEGDRPLSQIEKEYISHVLEKNRWNIRRSAKILGIDRTTLYKKIEKYGLKSRRP